MRVDYTRRPSPAEGVAVDPEDDRKVPSRPSSSTVCSEVGLSAWSHSLVPRGSNINWAAYVIRWPLFIRVGTSQQERLIAQDGSPPPGPPPIIWTVTATSGDITPAAPVVGRNGFGPCPPWRNPSDWAWGVILSRQSLGTETTLAADYSLGKGLGGTV